MDFFSPLVWAKCIQILTQLSQKIPIVSAGNPTLYSTNQHPFYLTFWSPKEKGCFFFFFFFSLTLTLMLQLLFDSQEHKHWLQEQLKLHQEPKYKMKGCGVGNGRKWYCWNSPLKFPKWCLICESLKAAAIPLVSKWSFFWHGGREQRYLNGFFGDTQKK